MLRAAKGATLMVVSAATKVVLDMIKICLEAAAEVVLEVVDAVDGGRNVRGYKLGSHRKPNHLNLRRGNRICCFDNRNNLALGYIAFRHGIR